MTSKCSSNLTICFCNVHMTFLLALLVVSSEASTKKVIEIECKTCVKVESICHEVKHVLDIKAPFRNKIVIPRMGLLRSSNILFYSFEPNISDKEYYKVGFVNLDNSNNSGVLSGEQNSIFNFGVFDFDQDNRIVYLGGSDGIYALDTVVNSLSFYSSRGDTILNVFYKGNVFFIRKNELKIVKKRGDSFVPVLEYEPVKNFVIDKEGVIVFLSSYGLFAYRNGETVYLSKNAYIRGLTVNLDGVVYAWWVDGIYKVIVEKNLFDSKLVKIAHIATIGAMTFDNFNNILFTSENSLFRLIKTNTTLC